MNRIIFRHLVLLGLASIIFCPKSAQAVSFSLDVKQAGLPGSDSLLDSILADPQFQNNIYYGGVNPYIGTNVQDVSGNDIMTSELDNLNALSKGTDPTQGIWDLLFSVDERSQGTPGSEVYQEMVLSANEGEGDIFFFNPTAVVSNTNFLRTWGEERQHGLTVFDELDAFDVYEGDFEPVAARYNVANDDIYFSTEGSPDILLKQANGGINLFASALDIGLQIGDDIDALVFDSQNNQAFFSLARGSQTLINLGRSGADIFTTNFNGSFQIAEIFGTELFAENMGLLFEDDIDALDTAKNDPVQPVPTPEPITGLVLAAGLGGAALKRAKDKSKKS